MYGVNKSWFREWAHQYDGFPDDYLVLDTESTGNVHDKDLILQIGWCDVRDRCPVDNSGVTLNWTKSQHIDTNWLRRRIDETAAYLTTHKQQNYPWTYDGLATGVPPVPALANLLCRLIKAREDGRVIVAHNGVGFDFPVLTRHFDRFLGVKFDFRPDEIWDTGAMEKASQLNQVLCPGEMPGDFAYRTLLRTGDGVKWSLHNHAVVKYDLDIKYGLDMAKSHTAPFDAYVTHLLLEEFHSFSKER